jgi:two-component system response regulator HydG
MSNKSLSVLVVDDSHDMLEVIRRNLNEMGLNPFTSDNVVEGIEILETTPIDLVITDLNMPEVGGIQLVKYISHHFANTPVLVITGFPDVQGAVDVMKMGAVEYLIKPFTNEELNTALDHIITEKITKTAIAEQPEERIESFFGIIGISEPMQLLYKTIERTKNNKATVLVTGESGTGKEMVARAIHYNSSYSSAPFVAVNCGAIPDQLLESELFGHLKGAFTGAVTTRAGFFQAADKGTIFLDEISNSSHSVQAKLLRVIQEKEITMLGGTKSQKVDVRIISASNADLKEQIEKATFREDLFYRLNVVTIHIPPLRERKEDIPILINHFNQIHSLENKKKPLKFPSGIKTIMKEYSWPGNVRELENFIHRLVIMIDGSVSIHDLPDYMKMSSPLSTNSNVTITLAEMEKKYILKVLSEVNNNKTKAAELLNIDRKTLREKIT